MRLGSIVLDSNDIEELSDFYSELLGWKKEIQIQDGGKWAIVMKEDYTEIPLVFQDNPNYKKPKWPGSKDEQQQMLHLDFYVKMDDFEKKIEHAIKCGAQMADKQFTDDWKVMIDPAGHPFCIIPIPKDIWEQRYENKD